MHGKEHSGLNHFAKPGHSDLTPLHQLLQAQERCLKCMHEKLKMRPISNRKTHIQGGCREKDVR